METDPGMSSKFRKSHTLTWFSMRTFKTVHTLIYEKYWMCNQWDGYSTIHYSRVQYSTIQYCTVQYNTMLYSTVRYITPGEETTHTITHRPTISLSLCSVTMLPLCPVSPPPPYRSKDQGWLFKNKFARWRWKFFVHRSCTKKQKNTVHRSFPFRNDHPWYAHTYIIKTRELVRVGQ